MHISMASRVRTVFARRVVLVDFGLQSSVRFAISHKEIEQIAEHSSCCVGTCYDSQRTVGNHLSERRRFFIHTTFVYLWG